LQEIGKADQEPAFTQANGVVDIGEGEKIDGQIRNGSARAKLTVSFLEDSKQPLSHVGPRLTRTHCGLISFLFLAASSCSVSSWRWSCSPLFTASRALLRRNSYSLDSSLAFASLKVRNLA